MQFIAIQQRMHMAAVILAIAVLTIGAAFPASADMTGLQIIEQVYNRPTGEDMQADLTMTLTNSRGDQRVRTIQQFSKNFGDGEKKIMFFVSPADVRGTSFMNWSYDEEGKDDDQWIYLPALKKVKRISSEGKSDAFMGSDFTYDDLGDRHPAEDTHTLLREEACADAVCYVVESVPRAQDSMYSHTVSWVIKDTWIGAKKEFYDEDGELLKILSVKQYEQINGYWIILDSEMQNVQAEHTTRMQLQNVALDSGLDDNNFTERMMRRGL